MKEARTTIAKELGVDPEQYGLFVPPKDDQAGKWCKDDYPLSFYGYEGEREGSKESFLMSNANTLVSRYFLFFSFFEMLFFFPPLLLSSSLYSLCVAGIYGI